MDEAGLGFPYLNVDYGFAPRSRIRLFDQTYFENIIAADTYANTSAIVDGTISHTEFDDWTLDLGINAQENRFLVLNKEYDEEELYYGSAYVNGVGKVYGKVNALNIDLKKVVKGTALKILLSDLTTVGDYSFINFIDRGVSAEDKKDFEAGEFNGVQLKFDIDVTPDAEVEVVIEQKVVH